MQLTDESPMPFGKAHKGKPMDEVPASYLIFLMDAIEQDIKAGKAISTDRQRVYDYCVDNKDVLYQEAKSD